jgi:hypothetical protein
VAAVGNNVLIGANGVNGSEGAAYLYNPPGTFLQSFTDPNKTYQDYFGGSVAAVGNKVLVGAGNGSKGAAYLYNPASATPNTPIATFTDPNNTINDLFGSSVAAVGNNVLVGAEGVNGYKGAAYLYNPSGTLLQSFTDPNNTAKDRFGSSVAAVGSDVLVGALGANGSKGAAYLYNPSGTLLQTFTDPNNTAGDESGFSVAGVGNNVLVAAPGVNGYKGAAYLYDGGIATSLQFVQRPTSVAATAVLPPITVQVLDQSGNPLTTDNGRPITIALGANPGGATLGGTLTVNDVNGIATFSDLSLSAAGTGYTLVVSSAGLPGVTSMPFNITAPVVPPTPKVHYYATGADNGGAPLVNVYNASTGALVTSFYGLPATFTGGVRVAVGDVNGDGTDDIICAAGPGAAPQITVYDGKTFQPIMSFYGLPVGFTGGCFVAAGDVNGDGFADIIVSADRGGGPQVTITSGKDGSMLASFYATAPTFTGGIRVAAADLFGSGHADVIAAAGPGGGPQVTIFSGKTMSLLTAFYTLAPTFTGGLYVAGGDVRGIGLADIIVGAEKGGGPQVTVFDGRTDKAYTNFYALNPTFTGGVRVGANVTGTRPARILSAAGPSGGPQVTIFDGVSAQALGNFFAYPSGFTGGVFVA